MSNKKGTSPTKADQNRSRAWRAVKEFRKLQTSLNTYVRAVTGNPAAKVLPTEGDTRTDGKTVWLRPPIELGDDLHHERELCGKRGPDKRQMCQACDIREMAMACVFHETAHCVFGTFVDPTDDGIDVVRDLVREWHPKGVCDHAAEILGSWPIARWGSDYTYLDYANSFTPVFKFLLNALEDSRVNAAQFRARPGTKVVMEANMKQLFEDGIGTLDGNEAQHWHERPVSMQVLVGAFLEASGYPDLTNTLHPVAQDVLRKPELSELLLRVANADDVHVLVARAADVFRKLHEEGVIDVPKCEPMPPMPPMPSGNPGDQSDSGTPDEGGDEHKDEAEPSNDVGSGEGESGDEKDPDAGGEFGQSESGSASKPEESAGEQGNTGTGQPGNSTTGVGPGGATENNGSEDDKGDDSGGAPADNTGGESGQEASEGGEDDSDSTGSGGGGLGSGESPSDDASETGSDASGSDDADESQADDSSGGSDLADHSGDEAGDLDEAGTGGADGKSDGKPDGESAGDAGDGDEQDGVGDGPDAGADATGSGDGTQADTQGDVSEGGDGSGSEQSDSDDRSSGAESGLDGAEASSGEPDELDHDESEPVQDSEPRGHGEAGPEEAVVPEYQPDEYDPDAEHDAMAVPEAPEEDEPAPAIQPMSSDQLLETLKRITLHNILNGRDKFATGRSEISEDGTIVGDVDGDPVVELDPDEIAAIATAVMQAAFFDTSSREVRTVRTIKYGDRRHRWYERFDPDALKPTEAAISKTVQEARIAFDANARGRRLPNLKAGRIDGRNLAKRVPAGDPRMFKKNVLPKRRDYKVIITIDISGSTKTDDRITRIKRAAYGQAEMLHRVGIPFELWAHSAGFVQDDRDDYPDFSQMDMWMFPIKGMNDPWNKKAKQALADLIPQAGNLDGHTLEFMRKRAQACGAADAIICYYTDGAMPASNYHEELDVLQREIKLCRQLGIALLAVGIDTNSPEDHGFRTAQVNSDADLPQVVRILKEQMA